MLTVSIKQKNLNENLFITRLLSTQSLKHLVYFKIQVYARNKNRSKITRLWEVKVGYKIYQIRSKTFKVLETRNIQSRRAIVSIYRERWTFARRCFLSSRFFLSLWITEIGLYRTDCREFDLSLPRKKPPFCCEKNLTFPFLVLFEQNLLYR